MRTPVALPPILKGWSSVCQSVVVSHKLPPLKNALQRKQRGYASKLKAPHRALSATSCFAKPTEPRQLQHMTERLASGDKHQDKF